MSLLSSQNSCHLVLGKVLDVHALLVDIPLLIVALLLRGMRHQSNTSLLLLKMMRGFDLHLSIEIISFRSKVTAVVISKVILQQKRVSKKETKKHVIAMNQMLAPEEI